MAQISGSDNTSIKSENVARESVWSEEHDCVPLKQRLKMLLASKLLPSFGHTKSEKEIGSLSIPPIDIIVKKEDEHSDSQSVIQGFHSACFVGQGRVGRLSLEQSHAGKVLEGGEQGECNSQDIEADNCICSDQITFPEVNAGIVGVEKADINNDTLFQHSTLLKDPIKQKVKYADTNVENSLGICLNRSSSANTLAIKIKSEITDDFLDDLDHIVLKERQRMLLSRKLLGLTKVVPEGIFSGLSSPVVDGRIEHNAGMGKGESHSGAKAYDIPGGNSSVFCTISEPGSSNGMITGSSSTTPQCPVLARHCQGTESTESGDFTNIQENNRRCSSKKTATEYESSGAGKDFLFGNRKTLHSSTSSTYVNVKVEPLDNDELQSPPKNAVSYSCFSNIVPVKSELEIHDESFGDKVDHMLLRDRMKLLASREVPNLDVYGNFECSRKIALDCRPIVSESAKPLRIKHPRKKRKTATDSVETALEEDAPGLLQVLIDKGVSVNEIKLYGQMKSNEVLDDSLTEDSFTELEAVISKLFSQRDSLLKFAPIRCAKGEKASYCLACLISLVEQARYLLFRKWPVEWGWCRDLQSFIFVFERHNRIVLERPEYGYATYFFELVDSFPIGWQIKRLVTAMKLTSCSRVTLLENKALMVGEDLTESEARVLVEYGWIPDSGLGTMLNYCDRVVHDRKNERDSSEWKSKIGKLLMDGYNGGTIVSTDIPKKVMEYSVSQSPQIKLEL